ncbi:MAG: type I 3-dehydroquinate dehydratase [Bacteroidales bacterium]|nr:type I 3-dehydroquinate dehydratase [Bacteroidales bacterium]
MAISSFHYHNYKETASKETLQILIDQCFREGANIAKIAINVNTEQMCLC